MLFDDGADFCVTMKLLTVVNLLWIVLELSRVLFPDTVTFAEKFVFEDTAPNNDLTLILFDVGVVLTPVTTGIISDETRLDAAGNWENLRSDNF